MSVYKARHLGLNRVVALKMILAGGHAGPSELAHFRSAAEAVARLKHPNVVQVYDVGESGGLPYFSLEFVEGGSLDRKLVGTPLPPAEAAALVETLARAMAVAHAAGLIHRDLKPANILLAPDGTPKVTDCRCRQGRRPVHTGARGELLVYRGATGEVLHSLQFITGPVTGVAISTDGGSVGWGSADGMVRVLEKATGREKLSKAHLGGVSGLAFSPDARRIVWGGGAYRARRGEVGIWDAVTGEKLLSLDGHTGWVTSVAIGADGRCIASAGWDKTVRVWDAATGQEIQRFEGHTGLFVSG